MRMSDGSSDVCSSDLDLPPGTVPVPGDLDDAAALCALVEGCSALLPWAGAVRAHSPDEFARVSTDATSRIGQLCAARGVRLVLISSLAAREPALSPYASSKHAAERALGRVPRLDWCALRPPLVYGPRDRATLPLFRMRSEEHTSELQSLMRISYAVFCL